MVFFEWMDCYYVFDIMDKVVYGNTFAVIAYMNHWFLQIDFNVVKGPDGVRQWHLNRYEAMFGITFLIPLHWEYIRNEMSRSELRWSDYKFMRCWNCSINFKHIFLERYLPLKFKGIVINHDSRYHCLI